MVDGMARLPIVGVMGSGLDPCLDRAQGVGRLLAKMGVHLLTGGGGGVMESVSRAFYETPERQGRVIGILPCAEGDPLRAPKHGYPNSWVEIPIATHLPLTGTQGQDDLSRNHINVLSADAVVAFPGGPGTLSEVKLALRYKRPVVAFLKDRSELPGVPEAVQVEGEVAGVRAFLERCFGGERARQARK